MSQREGFKTQGCKPPDPMRPHPPPRKRLVVATVENGQGEALLPEESYLQARVLAGTQSGT